MLLPRIATAATIGWLTVAAGAAATAQSTAETVDGNDNRRPAGILADGALTVRLYAALGEWRPERDEGPALNVAAFGEEGGPLVTPGPLLRVFEGTDVIVVVRNTLAERLSIHGLVTRPAAEDAVFTVEPGQTREIRFAAGVPGTYHYWATTAGSALNRRQAVESQLGGAFIVDLRGSGSTDRVLVMTEWDDSELLVDEVVDARTRRVFAINGRSWPHTERLDEQVGRPANWRIVNLTQVSHPMHLHGFYFSVRSIGTGLRQTTYAPEEYRTAVTEAVPAGRTVQLVWTPERAGNWLLHCHMIYVERYPQLGSRQLISTDGGQRPLWSRDGRELYFHSLDGRQVLVVPMQPESTLKARPRPQVLFEAAMSVQGVGVRPYDVALDGRFFIIRSVQTEGGGGTPSNITVVLNWLEELKRLVSTN